MAFASRRLILKRRIGWALAISASVLLLAAFILWPIFQSQWMGGEEDPYDATRLEAAQQALHRAMQVVVTFWIFALGASFASFINVVAYRMPRGVSIIGSSRCPRCQTKLTFKENIPVLGWLILAGRCRTCKLPISPRYVAVEIVLGSVFVLVMAVELVTGGVNLPNQSGAIRGGFVEVLFSPNWHLLRIYILHVTLLTWLLTACLIRFEKLALPWKLTAFGGLVGAVVPLIWLDVLPVLAWNADTTTSVTIGMTSLLGAFAGFVCALVLFWSFREWFGETSIESLMTIGGMIGLYIGWQAVLAATTVSMILIWTAPLFLSQTSCSKVPLAVWWSIGTLIQICAWKWIDSLPFFPSQSFHWLGLLGPLTLFTVSLIACRAVTIQSSPATDEDD